MNAATERIQVNLRLRTPYRPLLDALTAATGIRAATIVSNGLTLRAGEIITALLAHPIHASHVRVMLGGGQGDALLDGMTRVLEWTHKQGIDVNELVIAYRSQFAQPQVNAISTAARLILQSQGELAGATVTDRPADGQTIIQEHPAGSVNPPWTAEQV